MKLQEQRQFCSEKKFPLAVGTPNRIHKLLDIGVLKLSQAEAILFDVKKYAFIQNTVQLRETYLIIIRWLPGM
jgi:hypothetical protein